ncbi:MAG TPA: endonuclease/exonuclease/phosphatase family protein [Candidatus Latescibacteria bacterium]|jgi:endonuclease/exonuclease/phosphatase family metal-dependent hydrolase|nr:endonuclease/exonuclease/phosphatase family protein [Candidatus Latescibacterota bacterium]HJP32923.1 endonuclease/exonuclease/phosphatase family protein [Candidatus Latescibacterota bacterium]
MEPSAFTVSFWLCTTASSSDLPVLVSDKDWNGGDRADVTSHHDFGVTRTSGSEPGWAIALGLDGAWAWNVGDGKNRLDYRPPAPAQMVADGDWHLLAFSVDPTLVEARLYRDGVNVAVYSLAGLTKLHSGEPPTQAAVIGETPVQIEDLRIEPGAESPADIEHRWRQRQVSVSAPRVATARVSRLRVMAWNIWHGGRRDGDGAGLTATIDAIRTAGADVVAMQETYGSGAHIAAGLGFSYYLRSSNLSVMSRYPIVATHDLYEPFRFGGVTLQLSPDQRLKLFSLWIHYLPDYGGRMKDVDTEVTEALLLAEEMETRGREIDQILALLQPTLAQSDKVPVIVAGDFNSPSHLDWGEDTRPRHRDLVVDWPVSRSMERAGFVDAFRHLHPDPVSVPGFTWSPRSETSWKDRIDYVYLHGSSLRPVSATVHDEQAPRWPSDHAAVVVDVEIAP